jgi:hypothetical protein
MVIVMPTSVKAEIIMKRMKSIGGISYPESLSDRSMPTSVFNVRVYKFTILIVYSVDSLNRTRIILRKIPSGLVQKMLLP